MIIGLAGSSDIPVASGPCGLCPWPIRENDVVCAQRIAPYLDGVRRFLGWTVYHRECVQKLLDEGPRGSWEELREQALAGNLFD